MGFWDFFKRKTVDADDLDLLEDEIRPKPHSLRECVRFDFLWGFIPDEPKLLPDDREVEKLGRFLLGDCSGLMIQAMLHPYQVLGKDWNLWEDLFQGLYGAPGFDESAMLRSRGKVGLIELPSLPRFRKPEDDRLDPQVNRIYQRLVPIVVPFLSFEVDREPLWVERMAAARNQERVDKLVADMNRAVEFATGGRATMCAMGRLDPANPKAMLDTIHEMATTVFAKHLDSDPEVA